MKPEDFELGPTYTHPEIVSNPEAMQPAEQITLRHLLDVITNKTVHGYDCGAALEISLREPGANCGAANIARFKGQASPDDPNRLARIHTWEEVGTSGDRIITNYFILDSHDGLHIEKHSLTSNPRREMARPFDSLENAVELARKGIARIAKRQETQAMEDELGLSFVSEEETRDLLKLLDRLEPFEKNRWLD